MALIAIAAAVGLYFLVAQPNPAADPDLDPDAPQEFTWQSWSAETFEHAQAEERLIFLLVTNPLDPAAAKLRQQIESHTSLPRLLASRMVPIIIDRRIRPDIAERYAEARPYQAMLLLPTGEALIVLEGTLDEWEEQATETDRYWRDHREDIRDRVEEFWTEYEESVNTHRPPREPAESDLETIDAAVRELAETAIKNEAMGIWRVDVSAYLMIRSETEPWAGSLLEQILDARSSAMDQNPSLLGSFSRDVVIQFSDELDWSMRTHPREARKNLQQQDRLAVNPAYTVFTATDVAAGNRRWRASGRREGYPGQWINAEDSSGYSLPHWINQPAALDGYLLDALAWLDYLTADTSTWIQAAALADSIWANLWSPDANALRDKPIHEAPVREIELFPRPQLGRAAGLFDAMARQSGDTRYSQRADSCLAAFAPYISDAGAAAAYYGIALIKRLRPDS